MVAEIFNNFFSNVITKLNLPTKIAPSINNENVEYPVLKPKMKFVNHPSIKTVRDRFTRTDLLITDFLPIRLQNLILGKR